MFVAIQKTMLKKPNQNGAYREYEVTTSTNYIPNSERKTSYSYYPKYDAGRFDRPHREAYKVSLHHNFRENGKVKTKQCVLCTADYYCLADGFFCLYDWADSKITKAASLFEVDVDTIYDMVNKKLDTLQNEIIKDFQRSEEYKEVKRRKDVQAKYQIAKAAFVKKYSVEEYEYDYCYNIFGELMNKAYLDKIIKNAENFRSYSKYSSGNYNSSNYDFSGYFKENHSNYSEDEKTTLKQFYKALSMKFHPDMNMGEDTTKQMQLLNKLKEDWGV